MRLINVSNLEINDFWGPNVPPYAILSHTWGDGEASFQQWTKRWTRLRKFSQPGFAKIVKTCKQARKDGLQYAWVDTVCIDKTSSAELSEAINSMFAWYSKAKVCYVYLSDVEDQPPDQLEPLDLFRKSRWFTRGWTLQELLAPANLIFYSKTWTEIGTKNALAILISEITGIDSLCLHQQKRIERYSVAQRMSWAANRSTTREEDMAYCLLGLFNINMPLLYGEGKRAFRRLQEEIIKVSDDQSVLAFDSNSSTETLFAAHPAVYQNGRQIHPNFALKITTPFSMSNAGLSIATPLIQTLSPFWVLAVLNCVEVDAAKDMRRSQICLPLFGKDNRYMRARFPVCLISKTSDETTVRLTDEVRDLTTPKETNYLISYWSRIYSVYGTEMDTAFKGFGLEGGQNSTGFMLTFPRGLGGWTLWDATSNKDIHPDISFFIPSNTIAASLDEPGVTYRGGLLVFEQNNRQRPFVCVYLSLEMKSGALQDWACRIVPKSQHMAAGKLNLGGMTECQEKKITEMKGHYHHLEDTIVAARTRFSTLAWEPCHEVIMVEIVFNAEELFEEQDLG
jgi:hypothetical protein